jgi:ElaB/YqjD/DUF883 family membrane-anchored ribosome-binding protein
MDYTSEDTKGTAGATAAEAARTVDTIYEKARVARDKLNAALGELGAKADQAEKQVRRGVAHTESQIKEHPWASVALAAGLGVVIGLLLNRRR